jgi:hypothetical protein
VRTGAAALVLALTCSVLPLTTVGAVPSQEEPAAGEGPAFTPIAASVPTPPQPVTGSDRNHHLAYELILTSVVPFPLDVTSVEVRNARSGEVIESLTGPELASAIRPISEAAAEAEGSGSAMAPSGTSIVWLNIAIPRGDPIPKALRHEIGLVGAPAGEPANLDAIVGDTRVNSTEPVDLAPPLPRGTWYASDGCCLPYTHHRRGLVTIDGELLIPQRYAIDFYKVDDQYRTWVGDPAEIDSYLIYGQPALAAAAGTVVAASDGRPDQPPPEEPPSQPLPDTVGNYVIVKIEPKTYLLYAHLKPGSIEVENGDRVKTGQRLAQVGNSGFSSTPHLHFNVLTRRTFFPSDSPPFTFTRFDLVGQVPERIWDENIGLQPTGELPYEPAEDPGPRRRTMPLNQNIITFP